MLSLALALAFLSGPLVADDAAPPAPATRAEEIEQARSRKAAELEPETVNRAEATFNFIKENKIVERITNGLAGLRIRLGGLITGSGFALGPEYLRRDLQHGNMIVRSSLRASLQRYYLVDAEVSFPKLADNHYFLNLYTVHRNYPSVNYYGPGASSHKSGRSDFLLEDTAADFTTGIKPFSKLKLGVTGGYLRVNVSRGRDTRLASAERLFSPATTPGIDRQSDFLRGGAFVQLDWRDIPGGPRHGGNYIADFRYFWDRRFNAYSFRRLDLEAQQYIGFFNQRRVIALRAKSSLSYANPGQRVPFYLQPTVGGSDDLRGFRPFRFYDDNLVVLNGEYRWEVFSGLDMALFYDTGKVFQRHSEWNLAHLEHSAGFGFRFNVRNDVFMRIDFGFCREGFQAWLKFNNVF